MALPIEVFIHFPPPSPLAVSTVDAPTDLPLPTPAADAHVPVPAGSLWFASQLLDAERTCGLVDRYSHKRRIAQLQRTRDRFGR